MKYSVRHLPLAALLGTLLFVASAQAQEFKVGFVNIDRIFRDANTARAAQERLEKEFSQREKNVLGQGEALQKAITEFEREAPTLSESQRTSRQRQLADQERDFQRKRAEFQEDLSVRKTEELNKVIERANIMVKQVAETEHYDVVFQEAVYINPKHDITDKVIKAMDTGAGTAKK